MNFQFYNKVKIYLTIQCTMNAIIFAICSISQHLNLQILSPEQNNHFDFPEPTIQSQVFLDNV